MYPRTENTQERLMLVIPNETNGALNYALTTPGFIKNINETEPFQTIENMFKWLTGHTPEISESLFGEKIYETTKNELKPINTNTKNMYIFLAILGCGITARQHNEEGTPTGFFSEPLTQTFEIEEDTLRVRPPKNDNEAADHVRKLWNKQTPNTTP